VTVKSLKLKQYLTVYGVRQEEQLIAQRINIGYVKAVVVKPPVKKVTPPKTVVKKPVTPKVTTPKPTTTPKTTAKTTPTVQSTLKGKSK